MSAAEGTERVILALGSNIEPERHLRRAAAELRARFPVLAVSSVWRTPPVGAPGPDFLNAALAIECPLPIRALKYGVLRPLESVMGRVRWGNKNAPRVIDIDPVVRGDVTLDAELWKHAHLAVPVSELLPDLEQPGTGRRLAEAAASLRAALELERLPISL